VGKKDIDDLLVPIAVVSLLLLAVEADSRDDVTL